MWSSLGTAYKCIVLSSTAIYVVTLVLLLLKKNESEARSMLQGIHPSLGSPLPLQDLAVECGISNLKAVIFDIHALSHLLGWFLATVALRDVALSWVCGFVWEIVESSLEHNIPELRECWWDKLIVDYFGCNNLGVFLGWLTLRYLNVEQYNWMQIMTPDGSKLHQMGFFYFIPGRNTLQQNYYGLLKSAKTCVLFVYALLIITQLQVNIFFIKAALWIPADHYLVYWRCLIVIASLLIYAGPSIYKRGELTGWTLLLNMALSLEGLLALRFGHTLLFSVKGDAFVVNMLIILNVFVLFSLTLVGVLQHSRTHLRSLFTTAPCCYESEKIKCH